MTKSGKKGKGKSVENTFDLLNDFESKKNYFEYNIRRLKLFQPTSLNNDKNLAPSTVKRLTRLQNSVELSVPSQDRGSESPCSPSSPPPGNINQLIFEHLQNLFETNQNLIETIKNLQISYETIKSDYKEISNNFKIIQNENNELHKQLSELKNNLSNGTTVDSINSTFVQPSPDNNHLVTLNNKIADIEQKMHKNDIVL